jgi:predicted kinase
MNTLIMTVGLPRAGKSTWARKYSEENGIPLVEPDAIRLALYNQPFIREMEPLVWHYTLIMVKSLFFAGHKKVILDNTGVTESIRRKWCFQDDWEVRFKVFDTPKEECIKRAIKGNKQYLVPVIENMATMFEPLSVGENLFLLEETGEKE